MQSIQIESVYSNLTLSVSVLHFYIKTFVTIVFKIYFNKRFYKTAVSVFSLLKTAVLNTVLHCLFGITRKKIVSVLQDTQIFVSIRYYKEKKIVTFFSVCIISVTCYTNFCFCFWITGNNKTTVFPIYVVFKFFEDCSLSVSIVLKYLFLYSHIFRFCTTVLHSKYLLHIYIQILLQKWLRLRLRLTLF